MPPVGNGQVRRQELRGAERQGQDPLGCEDAIRAHACTAGTVTHAVLETVQRGRVISQKPKAGSHLKHNGKVRLTVSKGK